MIAVEQLSRALDVDGLAFVPSPRQARHPVEVRCDAAPFGRREREGRESAELTVDLRRVLFWQFCLDEPCFELACLVANRVGFAQLLVDGLQLGAETMFALCARRPGAARPTGEV